MRAGELRQRVTIQSKTVTKDSYGQESITWTTVGTYWASVEPLVGREFLEAKQVNAEVNTRIRLREQSTRFTPEMRASWESRTYEIVAVMYVQERNREVVLMCRELIP